MTKEVLVRQAARCLPSKATTVKEEKEFIDGFVRGAEWMQERMIEKAVEWIRTNWREYINGPDKDGCIAFAHWEKDFRRAMEE